MFWTRPVDLKPFIDTPAGAEDQMFSTDTEDSRCMSVIVNVSHTLCGRYRDRAVERLCRPEPCRPDISNTHQSLGIKHHLRENKTITDRIREAESSSTQLMPHGGAVLQQTKSIKIEGGVQKSETCFHI